MMYDTFVKSIWKTKKICWHYVIYFRIVECYQKVTWLCGCPETKAFYCFPCLLFKQDKPLTWNSSGFTQLSNFSICTQRHSRNQDHLTAVAHLSILGKVRINEQLNEAEKLLRSNFNQTVKRNREFIAHHIRAVIFLAAQGLAFRGHDESKSSHNRGNFISLLEDYHHFSGNSMLGNSLYSVDRPVFSGFSSDIQNDLIESVYGEVMDTIKEEIKLAKFISIMADETTDVSNISQLALTVRYTLNGAIHERLVDTVDVSNDRRAATLATVIINSLKENLDIDCSTMIIGQSYDGAANMAGAHNSVQTKIREVWPNAKFIHCYAHKFALVVKKSCESIKCVSHFFELTQALCNFFRASPKRGSLLEAKVPTASPTRWLSKGKCIKFIHINRKILFEVLISLSEDPSDGKTSFEASGLYRQLTKSMNVFLLTVFFRIFSFADILTKTLQSKVLDPSKVSSKVVDFLSLLKGLREYDTFESIVNGLDSSSEDSGEMFCAPPPRKRKPSQKHLVDSGYAPSIEEERTEHQQFKQVLNEIVDCLTTEMEARFGNIYTFKWVDMVNPSKFDCLSKNEQELDKCINIFIENNTFIHYEKDVLRAQFQTLYGDSAIRNALEEADDVENLLRALYTLDLSSALPLVADIANIAASTAITSVSCERSFSVLRRLKNYQRNSMSQHRTKQLMILNVESELTRKLSRSEDFYSRVIDRFARSPRRLDLIYKK